MSNQLYTHTAKHCVRALARVRISITATSENHCDRHENQLVRMSAPSHRREIHAETTNTACAHTRARRSSPITEREKHLNCHQKDSVRAPARAISRKEVHREVPTTLRARTRAHAAPRGKPRAGRWRSAGKPRAGRGRRNPGLDFWPFCPLARPL
jgi:hypothetical protein